jgi:Replication initiator protein A
MLCEGGHILTFVELDYQEIYDALFRLRSTTITTDIQAGGERETRGFGWIDSFRILTRENKAGSRVMQGLEITLNDWTFRGPAGALYQSGLL